MNRKLSVIAAALALAATGMAELSSAQSLLQKKPDGECTGAFEQMLDEEPLWGYRGRNRISHNPEYFYHRMIQYEVCRAAALDSPEPCMELPDVVDETAEISSGDTPRAKCLFGYSYLSKKAFEPTCSQCMKLETGDIPVSKNQLCKAIADPGKACDRIAETLGKKGIQFSGRDIRQCRIEFPSSPDDCYSRDKNVCLSKLRIWEAVKTGDCAGLQEEEASIVEARKAGKERKCGLILTRTMRLYCQWRETGFQPLWRPTLASLGKQDGTRPKLVRKPSGSHASFYHARTPRNVWNSIYGLGRNRSSDMVLIPAGEFLMGNRGRDEVYDNNYPPVKIRLSAFYMDRTPVTVADFMDFSRRTGVPLPTQPEWSTPRHPVVNVTWNEAFSFCRSRGKRLPTEAQWEKAARGGTLTEFSYGEEEKEGLDYSWRLDNSGGHAHPVAQKRPNQFGLYDMHGNVWQWVSDWYEKDYYQRAPSENPQGPETGTHKVLRGGAYNTYPYNTRSAFRDHFPPGTRDSSQGFRCVKPAHAEVRHGHGHTEAPPGGNPPDSRGEKNADR